MTSIEGHHAPDQARVPVPNRVTGPALTGLGVLALTALSIYGVTKIPVPFLGGPIGPRTFPIAITAGLGICGVLILVTALRGRFPADEENIIHWARERRNLLWFVAGLALNILLIVPVGFVVSSALMFACVARGFGNVAFGRDLMIGFVFALIVDLLFRFVLGVTIGIGTFGLLGRTLGVS